MYKTRPYEKHFKRPLDFILSLTALIALSPLFIIVALLVRLRLGSPILFSQNRPGLNGRIFKMYKFRTMTDGRDKQGNLLPDDVRLTRFGRFLRSSSLDELPGLINILNGDMSLIGPRPLLVEYLPLYSAEQKKRHNVRPGLSGLAQVNGRNLLTWEEKFNLDVKYVRNVSFMGDIKLIFLTLKKVVLKEGISATDHVTVEPFKGSE
ncbi:sugar transferase [Exiguobacterium sp. SH1S21]|uniref:sugar transferase n=1 Tax=Exiguobacterium sp. SH1S21 TaxID=2510953 RepID=UPI00103AC10C|nr:sugar transferase [Exiguobacterium sp. SH1S21]TCI57455.1 sugar transferase [Exiguobacterium sp. SH1S21]